jgi:hypothetical protein
LVVSVIGTDTNIDTSTSTSTSTNTVQLLLTVGYCRLPLIVCAGCCTPCSQGSAQVRGGASYIMHSAWPLGGDCHEERPAVQGAVVETNRRGWSCAAGCSTSRVLAAAVPEVQLIKVQRDRQQQHVPSQALGLIITRARRSPASYSHGQRGGCGGTTSEVCDEHPLAPSGGS